MSMINFSVWKRLLKKTTLVALIQTLIICKSNAQNLPGLQGGGMVVSNIIIDGRSKDWTKGFSAYNRNTDIYYSIGNSDKFLYLIIRATDPLIIKKIVNGGITLSVNPIKKEINNTTASLSFPIYPTGDFPSIDFNEVGQVPVDSVKKTQYVDSLNGIRNQLFTTHSKEMEVYGLKGITDTLLSVYNEYGIKAAASFEGNSIYNCEIRIPLENLRLTASPGQKFFYNIKLSAYRPIKIKKGGLRPPPPPPVPLKDRVLYSPTDFWGEYEMPNSN